MEGGRHGDCAAGCRRGRPARETGFASAGGGGVATDSRTEARKDRKEAGMGGGVGPERRRSAGCGSQGRSVAVNGRW